MKELAKKIIGKECWVHLENETQLDGVLKEVTDGAILLEDSKTSRVINLNYIVYINEKLW